MQSTTKSMIDAMVSRFLSWKLPKDFMPDAGVGFTPHPIQQHDGPHWPTGTNLFHAEQAREMIEHMLGDAMNSAALDVLTERRIVACANALEHISTEDLESGRMQNLAVRLADAERARDKILAALKTAQAGLVWYQDMHPEHVNVSDHEAMNEIAEAIAAAEQLKPQLQPTKNEG